MIVGTRVQHRRYPWMVGYVTGFGRRYEVLVRWNCVMDGGRHSSVEIEDDIQPTPVQP